MSLQKGQTLKTSSSLMKPFSGGCFLYGRRGSVSVCAQVQILRGTPSHFQRFHRQLQSAVRRRGSAVCYNLVASVLIYEGMEAKMAGVIVVGERKSTD